MKAMIFSAGLGTRLKPLTDNKPKALVEIGGRTLLESCVHYLKSFGISDITVNVHHFADQIIDFLAANNNFGVNIQISDERDLLLDTGGGILNAKELLDGEEPILLINTDIITNLDLHALLKSHLNSNALATLVVKDRKTSRYLMFNEQNQLVGWKNIKTGEIKESRPSETGHARLLAFSGIHLIQPKLLSMITETGKFSIIDLYLKLAKTENIIGYQDEYSAWMDLGKYEEIEEAEFLVKQLRNNKQ